MICIGIDPGTDTGVAIWDTREGKFLSLATLPIHRAMEVVLQYWMTECWHNKMEVVFEDARKRKWYGKGDTDAKKQGVGSVKRDCAIWQAFLKDHDIPFQNIHPIKGGTKVSEDYFKMISHYQGRTSEHSRDAAMLVIGR